MSAPRDTQNGRFLPTFLWDADKHGRTRTNGRFPPTNFPAQKTAVFPPLLTHPNGRFFQTT
ncbi:MAG: hypothetical protein KC423_30100, partial [Anaerolineales bacterium]|nr:hypothetical protein [Anaerolineales bacterium]